MGYNYRSEFAGSQPSLVDAAVNKLPGYGVFDFSATLKRDTGPWDVTFWVKNLMDKTYRTRTKADGVNSYVEFFGEPRSIGVTALLRFSDWR
jgi:outer membrane receptor protein involved in Fe transport